VIAIFGAAVLGVAVSGSSIVEHFTHVEEVVLAASVYLRGQDLPDRVGDTAFAG
jgi:malate/lactate dehydrogenase